MKTMLEINKILKTIEECILRGGCIISNNNSSCHRPIKIFKETNKVTEVAIINKGEIKHKCSSSYLHITLSLSST
jgi:hypothetical protein